MGRDLRIAGLILLVTGAAAITANAVRQGHKHVPWIGPDDVKAAPDGPKTAGQGNTADAASKDSGPGEPSGESKPDPNTVNLDEVLRHLDEGTAHFVDARKAEVYAEGHIRGAYNLPSNAVYDSIQIAIDFIPPPELVIVYCDGGNCESSHEVAHVLRQYEFENVKIFTKGWEELETSQRFAEVTVTGSEP